MPFLVLIAMFGTGALSVVCTMKQAGIPTIELTILGKVAIIALMLWLPIAFAGYLL